MNVQCYASGSTANLYSVSDGKTEILLEAGLKYKDMLKVLPKLPTEYSACFVSHKHLDHSRGIAEIIKRGIPVYFGHDLLSINRAAIINIGSLDVKAFYVPHDVPNAGFLIRSKSDAESIVFITDAFYSPARFAFSATIWMIESNYAKDLLAPGDLLSDRLYTSHMEISQTIKTLLANDLSQTREIHLLHLSDERSDEERFVREVQAATGVPTYAAPKIKKQQSNTS